MNIKEFDVNRYTGETVMIYGTTVGGKMIFQCLQKNGIHVACFIDRRITNETFCGVPVEKPETLLTRQGILLLAVTRSYISVCQFLKEIDFRQVYSCVNLIAGKSKADFVCERDEQVGITDFLAKYPLYVNRFCEQNLVLPTLEVFITEKCTLRCRDCSHLIKYYDHPENYDMDSILRYLGNVLEVVDYLEEVIILGGEPLLHKDLPRLLDYCYASEKIGDITIISNGTVIPTSDIVEAMKRNRVRLRLSDYGSLSVNLPKVRKLCDEQKIECFVLHELWTDMGQIYRHEYGMDELNSLFADCPFAFDLLLLEGQLCRCAHVAHLNHLRKIDTSEHDCIDFTKLSMEDVDKKRDELRQYMQIDYLEGCQYCNGIKNSVQGIEAAIQEERQ